MTEIFIEKLKEALEIEGREIALEDEFRHYDEWSSLSYLSVIAMMDEEFGVEIENEAFAKIKTVQALLDEVIKRQKP